MGRSRLRCTLVNGDERTGASDRLSATSVLVMAPRRLLGSACGRADLERRLSEGEGGERHTRWPDR
jgi:hypothetical protein